MVDASNLIDTFVELRFYMWNGDFGTVVYESMPEEGEKVRKKLCTHDTREDAEAWLVEHKKKYKEYLCSLIAVKSIRVSGAASRNLIPAPPSSALTKSSTPKTRKPRKKSSSFTEISNTLTSTPPVLGSSTSSESESGSPVLPASEKESNDVERADRSTEDGNSTGSNE